MLTHTYVQGALGALPAWLKQEGAEEWLSGLAKWEGRISPRQERAAYADMKARKNMACLRNSLPFPWLGSVAGGDMGELMK